MDSDLDSFFVLENIISAVFNGVPLFPDPKEASQMLPPTRSAQGSQDVSVPPASTPPLTNMSASNATSAYSLGKITRSASLPSSLTPQSGDDTPNQVRLGPMVPPPKSDKTSNISTESSGQPLLVPDLDMSSAIALSQKLRKNGKRSHEIAFGDEDNSVHVSRYISIAEASQLPEKNLRDELVKLYFTHFHPLCPVVDEVEFMEIYNDFEDDEEFEKRFPLTLFQAMMNVAFSHLSCARLPSTPYKSIYEGQKAYFEKASLLYRMRYTSDHLVLTKVALLLTYWSPFDAEYRVNNYWADRAFYHARVIRLWDHQDESVATSNRCRVIWWCCLLRDRLISIALRRTYRIHEAKSTWPVVSEADFGLEVGFPKFTNIKTKRTLIDSFIWLCKLSDVMRDIAVFHERKRFDREWSGGLINRASLIPEANQVQQFDSQLRSWKEGYLKVNGEYIRSLRPGTSKFPNYVLIICDSVLTNLYLPYIHCPPGSINDVQKFRRAALQRIKRASSAIALHCCKISQVSNPAEEFQNGIIAWIAFPMAVFKVLEEKDGDGSNETKGRSYKDFVPFLSSFAVRFRSAMLLENIMCETTSEIVERSTKLGIAQKDIQHSRTSPNPADGGKNAAELESSKDVEEAEILNVVAKMVDLRFSTDGST